MNWWGSGITIVALLVLTGETWSDEATATALVEKLGGKIIRDPAIAGNPIVTVELRDSGLTDDGLKEFAGLKHLRRLIIDRTRVTEAGVKIIARRRRAKAGPGNPGPAPVVFPCSGCGKNLKSKAEASGTKVQCPQCGAITMVPSSPPQK